MKKLTSFLRKKLLTFFVKKLSTFLMRKSYNFVQVLLTIQVIEELDGQLEQGQANGVSINTLHDIEITRDLLVCEMIRLIKIISY